MNCCYSGTFTFDATLLIALSVFALILVSEPDNAEAVLVEPEDNSRYQIRWTWDSNSSRSIGLIQPEIRVADESDHKVVGYITDGDGTRLSMFNEEQVVMVKYNLADGLASDWEIADRLFKGYFAISIPSQFIGKVESIRIFVNNNLYDVNDVTLTTNSSQVFTNSALTTHKLGSLLHLGGFTLGLEKFLTNVAIPIANDIDLKGNDKYDVRVFDNVSPVFVTHLRHVVIEFDHGLPIVWYELPGASDFGSGTPTIKCDPSPGSTFIFGDNIVKCIGTYDSGHLIYSYFVVTVPEYLETISPNDLTPVQINIDPFYPGSNTINLMHSTVVSIAILGNVTLDVRDVNVGSLHFGPNIALATTSAGWYRTDVNADSFDDLIVKFDVLDGGFFKGYYGSACIKGLLYDGETAFGGCDTVHIIAE